ncbi:ATP-binding protein [Streptomyces sp. NPDC094448]|uniref:ATP-binding protein n=1 Tax=Streptomyces sp. NPDC094448 TaxID=3366063 RepID=UPI0038153B4A
MLEPLRQGLPPIDPAQALSSAACSLSARYEAVRGARQFTRTTLKEWDLYDHFDDIALVVSELVTNALRHALPDEPARETFLPPVRLHLMRWPGRLVVAVRDPSAEGPGGTDRRGGAERIDRLDRVDGIDRMDGPGRMDGRGGPGRVDVLERTESPFEGLGGLERLGGRFPDPDGTAESGRGLFLVDAYADSWGWHPLAGALHGKVVWALFRLA